LRDASLQYKTLIYPTNIQERRHQRQLKVHEKTTYSQRLNAKSGALRKSITSPSTLDDQDLETTGGTVTRPDPSFAIAVTQRSDSWMANVKSLLLIACLHVSAHTDRHVEKESLDDYIAKKREMFLVEYALGVKRDEIKKLEQLAQEEERELELAERHLEEDAIMFDEFLKENDKNSVEAIKAAEQETKLKLEKVSEIKRLNVQITALKSEISKNEEQLQEYRYYKKFLEGLAPLVNTTGQHWMGVACK
jgi:type III secretory pathway component EscV